ncbi:jg23213 [Pararge aegeria aegeria]|uniref:Jg23213 protein n=1 Tax=Pararge aegeria aegeria TaxID=348720 RepID=A0A8S4S7M6_9NEOP|nr:jg23213 [Pararge aegeria aegeria]
MQTNLLNSERKLNVIAISDFTGHLFENLLPLKRKKWDLRDSQIPQCLKTKVFEQCVLPVMTYGTETWPLTMGLIRRLRVTQRAMERAMLGVSLRDQIRNDVIRRRIRVAKLK